MKRTAVAFAVAVLALAAALSAPATAAQESGGGPRTTVPTSVDPLHGVAGYLGTRAGSVSVALYERSTGRTYLLRHGPVVPQYTASSAKVDIMAMWLHRYQARPGTVPGNVPYSIQFLLQNMIHVSDNSAATGLFHFAGGCRALTRFNTLIPIRHTRVGCESPTYYGWGNTITTAADQAAIVRTFAYPNRLLRTDSRAYGLNLMENIDPTQRWGVSCGPWGTACDPPTYAPPVPGVTVALKNGWKFVPGCPQQDLTCPWQVNSMGWVHGQGRDYVLAVLTTDDPPVAGHSGMDYGIDTVQGVSQRIWQNLAP